MSELSEQTASEQSRQFWEKRYGRPLSPEEVEAIERRLVEFFKLLLELEQPRKEVGRG